MQLATFVEDKNAGLQKIAGDGFMAAGFVPGNRSVHTGFMLATKNHIQEYTRLQN